MPTPPRRGPSGARRDLIDQLLAADADHTTAAAAFHTATVTAQGLTGTERRALDILHQTGPITARELTARLALMPPTVTRVIDHLERKGLARRNPNPHDARSITIEPIPNPKPDPSPPEKTRNTALTALTRDYTLDQLTTITNFLNQSTTLHRAALNSSAEPT